MSQWLKSLTGCLCVLTVLMHLVPKGKFSRYVRFYGGLLFFLVAAGPLWKLLAGEGELERLLQLEFLKDDYYDLEASVAGMEELKNDQIKEAYRSELARQIREIALAHGIEAKDVQLSFGEDGYRITGVSMEAAAAVQETLSVPGAEQEDTGAERADLAAAVASVRSEIAGVYTLDLNRIQIRTGETDNGKMAG